MPVPFNQLPLSERIKFWQEIEAQLRRVLEICGEQIPPEARQETQDYLAHNELGLAWETIVDELISIDQLPSQAIREILVETGKRMEFDKPGNRNHEQWAEIRGSGSTHAPEPPPHSDS